MLKQLYQIGNKFSPGLQKIIRSVGWLSLEKALSITLNLTVGVYLIRYLGSDDFGKLSYCLSSVGLFEALAKLGLDAIVVRSLVKEEEATSDILGTALILKLVSSLVTLVAIICVTYILKPDSQTYWLTAIVAMSLVFRSTEAVDFWFQSRVLAKPIAIVRSSRLLIGHILRLGFILLGLPLPAFVWLLLGEEIIRATGTISIYRQYNRAASNSSLGNRQSDQSQSIKHWKFNFDRAKTMLKDSWPLILSGVMISIYMKIDQVMLGSMASTEAVGNYASAVKFSEVWYFFPMAICSSVFPSILQTKQRSTAEYYRKLQQLYDFMAWFSILVGLVMTVSSGILINVLLGAEFLSAGKILAIHVWAAPFVFLGVARSQWLLSENLTILSFACTMLGTITNLVLNFWLIPTYEGVGAAIATVISYAVSSHVSCIFYPKMSATGWMITKALFIPVRIRQNITYVKSLKQYFSK